MGFEMKTVLILFTPEVVMMYSMDDFSVCEDSHPATRTDDVLTMRQLTFFLLLFTVYLSFDLLI